MGFGEEPWRDGDVLGFAIDTETVTITVFNFGQGTNKRSWSEAMRRPYGGIAFKVRIRSVDNAATHLSATHTTRGRSPCQPSPLLPLYLFCLTLLSLWAALSGSSGCEGGRACSY